MSISVENEQSAEHRLMLEQIPEKLGIDFVPLIFSKFTDNPERLFHIWKLVEAMLFKGILHRLTKEMVVVVTANVKKCQYCSIAHKAFAKNLGLSEELVDCLDGNLKTMEPAPTRHLLQFARSLASDVEFDSEIKYKQLIADGFSQQELDELVFSVGVASLISTLANGMELNNLADPGFKKILNT